jgi:hypothetical protein
MKIFPSRYLRKGKDMKQRMTVIVVLVMELLLPVGLLAQGGKVRNPNNPKPFQNFLAPLSAPVSFLASDRGRQILRKSPTPGNIEILKALGEDVSGLTPISVPEQHRTTVQREAAPLIGTPCGTTTGIHFDNFEPAIGARPQNEEYVDFLLNRVSGSRDLVVMGANDYRGVIFLDPSLPLLDGATGYYVSRGDPCTDNFEGAVPHIPDPLNPNPGGGFVTGGGDPVVAADPARDAFFMADLRSSGFSTSIGVSRSSASTLLSPGSCPGGLHDTTASATCWPTQRLVNTLPIGSGFAASFFQDKPSMTVDERTSGTGAGNVYIAATEFDAGPPQVSRIWLVSCKNLLTACSSPIFISGFDTATQFSDLRVRPNGGVTITYTSFTSTGVDVKYVSCAPANAPATPSCSPPGIVAAETQPIFILGAEDFRVATYPTHDHRMDSNGTETYVAWSHCKVPGIFGFVCPDADVVMAASNNNGATWSPVASVNSGSDDQFMPWVKTDRSQNVVNLLYYSNSSDSGNQHRVQVRLAQIFPGASTPDVITKTNILTTTLNEPAGDPFLGGFFFGDYIGLAARGTGSAGGSHAHVGYTANYFKGSYAGALAPQQDNWHNRVSY